MTPRSIWISLFLVLTVVAGCGSPAATAPSTTLSGSGTPLTQDQAVELASVLYEDYQAGGALVTADIPYQSGTEVTIVGQVDFRHHEGHLTVTTVIQGQGTSVEAVDYDSSEVYEQGGPVVAQELAKSGRPGQTWVSRPADPVNRPLDKVIEILVSLASPSRDNPLLIQESNARYLGTAVVAGVKTDSFQYDPAITYFVDPGNGVLRRFVGSVQGFSGDITIDITAPGPQSLPPPPANQVLKTTGNSADNSPTPTGG